MPRLRLSSQSLKRAARLSDAMRKGLDGHMGERTQRIGDDVREHLLEAGAEEKQADGIAKAVADIFGKVDEAAIKKNPAHVRTRQLAFVSPGGARHGVRMGGQNGSPGKASPTISRKSSCVRPTARLTRPCSGRMLADDPDFNRDAAVQAFPMPSPPTRPWWKDDYYTAVDDLKRPAEDMGAGLRRGGRLRVRRLLPLCLCGYQPAGEKTSMATATWHDGRLQAVVEAFATATPSGKRNSYGHHARASYIRVEAGGDATPAAWPPLFCGRWRAWI